jgi:hypothetical protein
MAQTIRPGLVVHTPVASVPSSAILETTSCHWEFRTGQFVALKHRKENALTLDPWEIRKQFLGLGTEKEFLHFLKRAGWFLLLHQTGAWTYSEMQRWKDVFRFLLKQPPGKWPAYADGLKAIAPKIASALETVPSFTVDFLWGGKESSILFIGHDVVTAILISIYLDHLRGARFRFCARPDCRMPFEIETRHARRYCREYCAHLESLRRMRRRQKRERRSRASPK